MGILPHDMGNGQYHRQKRDHHQHGGNLCDAATSSSCHRLDCFARLSIVHREHHPVLSSLIQIASPHTVDPGLASRGPIAQSSGTETVSVIIGRHHLDHGRSVYRGLFESVLYRNQFGLLYQLFVHRVDVLVAL